MSVRVDRLSLQFAICSLLFRQLYPSLSACPSPGTTPWKVFTWVLRQAGDAAGSVVVLRLGVFEAGLDALGGIAEGTEQGLRRAQEHFDISLFIIALRPCQ